jgi:hypothetical protein
MRAEGRPHELEGCSALLDQLHFLDQVVGAVDLVHHPQHVAAVDVDVAGGAGAEVPVGVDRFDGVSTSGPPASIEPGRAGAAKGDRVSGVGVRAGRRRGGEPDPAFALRKGLVFGRWTAAGQEIEGGEHAQGGVQAVVAVEAGGGVFVRRWVPELAGVPTEAIFEPWKLGASARELGSRRSGLALGGKAQKKKVAKRSPQRSLF